MPLIWPTKYVDEVLDYGIDWSARLAGDTIASAQAQTVSGDVSVDQDSNGATVQTVWLSGGRSGSASVVGCTITTAGGWKRWSRSDASDPELMSCATIFFSGLRLPSLLVRCGSH